MTPLTVEAKYESGVLKLSQPLPLDEHETVRVTVHRKKAESSRGAAPRPCVGPAPCEPAATDANRDTSDAEESSDSGDWEMLNIWLEIPRSPTTKTITATRGEPILPRPYRIDESDLAPE